jgi:hypothetical protein
MKIFPPHTLPIEARSIAEHYALYALENSARYSAGSIVAVALSAFAWWSTGIQIFGVCLLLAVIEMIRSWENHVLLRIVKRALDNADGTDQTIAATPGELTQ